MVLGVTGGIATGKSSVAAMLGDRGAAQLSADQLAREAVRPGSECLARLVDAFGAGILAPDGALDRPALGARIFADDDARARLNAITHPAIARLAEERLRQLRLQPWPLIVYEAALLFEADAAGRVDRTLLVVADPACQIERLCRRDALTAEAARQRIDSQWRQAGKVARADFVIDNSGPVEATRQKVVALFHYLVPGAQR